MQKFRWVTSVTTMKTGHGGTSVIQVKFVEWRQDSCYKFQDSQGQRVNMYTLTKVQMYSKKMNTIIHNLKPHDKWANRFSWIDLHLLKTIHLNSQKVYV